LAEYLRLSSRVRRLSDTKFDTQRIDMMTRWVF